MKKAAIIIMLCVALAGCSTLTTTVNSWLGTASSTVSDLATYYAKFSAGVKIGLAALGKMSPATAPYVSVASAAVALLDYAVNDLAALAGQATTSEAVQTKLQEIDALITSINNAFGAMQAGS